MAILATGVLAGLKLSGHLAWPWLGVTAPLWLPLLVSIGLRLALVALVLGVVWWIGPDGLAAELQAVAAEVSSWFAE